MKYEDLTPEQQELVNTDFGEEMEKEAAAELKQANDLYTVGFTKFAAEAAESMDKAEDKAKEESGEKEKEEAEKKLSEEEKKEAAARGAFIAKGYMDGLMKLGEQNHQDKYHYLAPFLEEKFAAKGKAAKAIWSKLFAGGKAGKSARGAALKKSKAIARKYGPAAGAAAGGGLVGGALGS